MAGILGVAALLKVGGFAVSPMAQFGWLWQPSAQVGLVLIELLLAVWLVLPHGRYFSWLFAVVLFVAFSAVSCTLAWMGQASCGCFGEVATSPWLVFVLDLAVVTLLVVARPRWTGWQMERPALAWTAAGGLITVGAVLLILWKYGSLDDGIGAIRGERVIVSPRVIDFGTGRPGEVLAHQLQFRNVSDADIRLTDGTNDCTCRFGDLTMRIPPGETAEHTVYLRLPADSTPGWHCRDAQLYSDSPTNPLVRIKLCCRVQE